MAIVIDSFISPDEARALLEQLPTPLLDEGQERRLFTLDVPSDLERRMRRSLLGSACPEPPKSCAGDTLIPVAARIATGSVPMHQDCFTPFDAAETNFIDDGVAVVYLSGAGSFVVDDGSGEKAIDVVPGRLVAWNNGASKHRMDARPECGPRVMLGPVAIDAGGSLERAHDVWSTHPGYIGYCQNQAAEAVARGDADAARAALSNIGIPSIAADKLRELEERLKKEEEEKPKMVITLISSADPESESGVIVVGTGMDGEIVATLNVEEPEKTTYKDVDASLREALGKASEYGIQFVKEDATLLGDEHQDQTVEDLFGKPDRT